MVVICAGTSGFNCTFDVRYMWMHQKRLQGSHFAHLKQAAAANKLMIERRLDPCMSEVFPWAEIPAAHMLMRSNKHKPGNMAVLVQAPRTGLAHLRRHARRQPEPLKQRASTHHPVIGTAKSDPARIVAPDVNAPSQFHIGTNTPGGAQAGGCPPPALIASAAAQTHPRQRRLRGARCPAKRHLR